MNEIINAIPEYVITAVVSTAIFYLMNAGKNLLHSKVQHAKTTQSKELWGFIEQVANTAVNSLVSKNLTGDAKFAQATAIVQDALAKQGFTNVDVKSIESAVQAAYEKSNLTSNDTYDPVKVAIQTAPNRANDLTKEAD
ncbi:MULTISPECIES: phage holin, LLH family [Limosilactobacillus]|uniref:phage holin, LLH family n=1 Tax=Limosilactobacillus TaxID=2742598 RepID=UPI00242BE5B3|nr:MULTISPECIES: phage holin, LLH family [Limosilactobacillus]MCI6852167.1 phage holin, LLH family [Limosilactobacillus vaginalis]MDY4865236.1 phage holin, LLH family [Limosilactobacillus sp.]